MAVNYVKKGMKVVVPPHLARPYLDRLQKIDRNTYVALADMDLRISDEVCVLAMPQNTEKVAVQKDEEAVDDGRSDDGDPVLRAVMALNHGDKSHWTQKGLPAVEVVRKISGINNVTRADIERVAPSVVRTEI